LMAVSTALLAGGVWPVTIYFTPLMWTGYVLLVDAAVYRRRGRSLLKNDLGAFGWMAALSIPLWLVFEAYNLRLQNWVYVGLPDNLVRRQIGYIWSFATIWPAILETAELLLTGRRAEQTPVRIRCRWWVPLGLVCVLAPVVLPRQWGAYLFGLVWLGFIFLVDPINRAAGRASILEDRRRLWALLAAGGICGVLWELWNYWAVAKWVYVFPILQNVKVFEMPLPGYLGFPAFAVEVFVLYVYATGRLRLPYYDIR